MTKNFTAQIIDYKSINEIPGAWSTANYKALLAEMGLDEGLEDLSEQDITDMCYMSLNELDHAEAANVLLSFLFFDEELSEGKIEQLSHELADEKMWERFSDVRFHHRLFNAYGLLRSAYNGIFPQPTGVQLTLKVTAKDSDDLTIFDDAPKTAIVRLIAKGIDENATLNRLYSDQIAGAAFSEAEGIVWLLEELSKTDDSRTYLLTSSSFWLEEIKEMDQFEGEVHFEEEEGDGQV
ncbi:hypothetical protein LH51_08895 [Nitrincola sp. A-D6]|uniref:hypothetical protein n=1 Tax=Nitrincola sp. A-D6 TaxID=1545442 RepID=UPI00051FAF19|nr:hypothetical protein [Nitrincola sp. A-D6]KGK42223.1 hypothetical protein LH51_08895 [Nitrincola sp. A-D6]